MVSKQRSRLSHLAKLFCPLRCDERPEPRRSPGRFWDGSIPIPPRWSLASELPPAPAVPNQFETPGLMLHMILNHYRIAAGLTVVSWSPLRLYQLAQQYNFIDEPEDEDATPQYPTLVPLAAVIEAARVDGLGEAFDPWGEDEGPVDAGLMVGKALRLGSVEEIEEAIRFVGPVLIGFDWYADFRDPTYGPLNAIIHTPTLGTEEEPVEPLGRMCFVAYGYERNRRRLKCRTTLGAEYGRRGDVDITYFEIARQFREHRLDAWLVTAEEL